jgi:YggT family protein
MMAACFASAAALRPWSLNASPQSVLRRPGLARSALPPRVRRARAAPRAVLPADPALAAGMVLAGPVLNVFTVVMVVRIVLTWYPKTDLRKAPWIFLAVPTEPLLAATRTVIKPVGGVDVSPIVWVAVSTFVHEILMGPQGVLVLMASK